MAADPPTQPARALSLALARQVCAVDYAGNVSNGVTGFASMKKRRSSRLMML
jgi:hypothetical protein